MTTKTRKLALATTTAAPQAPTTPPTPEAAATIILTHLVGVAAYETKYAAEQLAQFTERFAKDPAGAFSWSNNAFGQAARLCFAKTITAWIETLKTQGDEYSMRSDLSIIRALRDELYNEVMRNAKWPERSTSPQSNEMSLCMMSQRAEWLEKMDKLFARYGISI